MRPGDDGEGPLRYPVTYGAILAIVWNKNDSCLLHWFSNKGPLRWPNGGL
jgi:hypothetical protein